MSFRFGCYNLIILCSCLMFLQQKIDQMTGYIKKLKHLIKWFQQLEENYVSEQEKLKNLLELAETNCNDMGKNSTLFQLRTICFCLDVF